METPVFSGFQERGDCFTSWRLGGKVPGPGGATQLGRSSPVPGRFVRGVGIALGQGCPRSIGHHGPAAAVPVVEGIHEPTGVIEQSQLLTAVVERSRERTKLSGSGTLRHHEVGPRIDCSSGGEGVVEASGKTPAREINPDSHLVEELDPLAILGGAGRVVVHFIEDHHAVGSVCVGACRVDDGD